MTTEISFFPIPCVPGETKQTSDRKYTPNSFISTLKLESKRLRPGAKLYKLNNSP